MRFVVDKDVMFGWKTALDVIKGLFLMDIDEDTPIDRIGNARPFDYMWLSDRITVGPKPFSRLNTLRADGNSRPAKG
jgi:hypothetical protein